ncbi:MAG: FGGY family carbohydrate kinase [Planctomycetota bacterium]
MGELFLGLDLGTTKAAAVLADGEGRVVASASRPHGAELPAPADRAEQDPETLLAAAWAAVRALPEEARCAARGIGVTGQMHGVVLLDGRGDPLGPLVTWQDRRTAGDPGFLLELVRRTGHPLRDGIGCVTLAWQQAREELPAAAAVATGAAALAAGRLCGLARPPVDPTDAASWGLFDLRALAWDLAALRAAGIPARLLPPVVPCGARIGALTADLAAALGLPAGIPVAAAIGDNQASLLATLHDPAEELALTLGTGGQLSAVLAAGEAPPPATAESAWELRPFPGGRLALVAASPHGGAAWAALADAVRAWQVERGLTPPDRSALFDRLSELGLAATLEIAVRPRSGPDPYAAPLRAALAGLEREDLALGAVARGLARAILVHLREVFPALLREGRARLAGSGNALRRTPLLQQMAEEVLGLSLVLPAAEEEAAAGAALLAARIPVDYDRAGRPAGP